jgi:UDP-N-acetylglucosamine diphosphorylase / glucose-1-phosphate thymidylyltransferase / UDP-N-acetylgalactosamine diphosphorylase / glucosamine-1-phosphate N-acetyltransferase / galactosamine-1-phosphate N-acetyltransferase
MSEGAFGPKSVPGGSRPKPEPELLLFEDALSRGWAPFALTRPVGELLFGKFLLRERIESATGLRATGYLSVERDWTFEEGEAPPTVPVGQLSTAGIQVVVLSRYVPPGGTDPATLAWTSLMEIADSGPAALMVKGEWAGWILPPGVPVPAPGTGSVPDGFREHEVSGILLSSPWDLVNRNTDQLRRDLAEGSRSPGPVTRGSGDPEPHMAALMTTPGVFVIGDGPLTAGPDVNVDPGVVFDTRDGGIHLATGVEVKSFTTLRGPASIGRDSKLLGGVFESISCGPVCRLRGEISDSVILGYSNKAHDGYLGHSLVGRWVNLGAFTTTSDLKNNYGRIRIPTGEETELDSGLIKVGAFIGDHAKTGIGMLLNAGTVVGAGSNVFGGAGAPRWIPPFSWGGAGGLSVYRLEPFLSTAQMAMKRRGVDLTEQQRAVLTRAWRSVHAGEEGDTGGTAP